MVLLEAMANEVAWVATDNPGVRALAEDSGAGVVTAAGDVDELARVIERLLDDDDERHTLAAKGKDAMKSREPARSAKVMVGLYKELLREHDLRSK